MSVSAPEQIDLRCPYGPKQLLAKVSRENPEDVAMSSDRLTLDIACRDCAKQARKINPRVRRAIHKFNVLGQLVETELQTDDD